MNAILLQGCSTIPMASYLKALGILRLVTEQLDPQARGSWRDDGFVLYTDRSKQELEAFLLNDYKPTPVLAPWNGGSGFYPGDNKDGFDPLRKSEAPRFQVLRESIEQIQQLLRASGLNSKPDAAAKEPLLRQLRNELNEASLAWLDAALMLTSEGPKYPPLLGTGGNDGRLDFTNNFLKQLTSLFVPATGAPTAQACATLPGALYATPVLLSGKGVIGQFSPGNAGGPNSSTGYEGSAQVNGWDFVLMLEGALLFAASVTRRQESDQSGQLSYPFTVRLSGSGAGSTAIADEKNARAEIWLPIWRQAAGLAELKAILSEGRATLGRRVCRDGLDFARAAAQLGIDRGIAAFQRYAFVMRSGKAYLATPLSEFQVRRTPEAELLNDLEKHHWLPRLRGLARDKSATASLTSTVQTLENALFDLTRRPGAPAMQNALIRIGELALWQSRHHKGRESMPVLPQLSGKWLTSADDRSDSYRLAAALAGLGTGGSLPMRAHLYPLEHGYKHFKLNQTGKSADCAWQQGRLTARLYNILQRRLLSCSKAEDQHLFSGATPADLAAVHALLCDPAMDTAITQLLPAMALLEKPFSLPERQTETPPLPLAYRLLKPLFCDPQQLRHAGLISADQQLALPREIPRLLAANRPGRALEMAIRQLRIAGLELPALVPDTTGLDSQRLLAALLVPISNRALRHLTNNTFKVVTSRLENA
ncbi:type I-U CRISPR-associated protein Csx17 [Granulosicoccaceae sp. 1_MG-2023]|nr:type I-U CRISPR-associated protein Csx17 [Granulosicoccaceae sp. 1_MG-2023]